MSSDALHLAKLRTDDIKRRAVGRWGDIHRRLVPQISAAIEKNGNPIHCPFHQPSGGAKADKKFRVYRTSTKDHYHSCGKVICTCEAAGDGIHLVMYATGWSFAQAIDEIELILGGRVGSAVPAYSPPPAAIGPSPEELEAKDKVIREKLKALWADSLPLDHPDAKPARLWFRNRLIGEVLLPLEDVRYHPQLPYTDDDGVFVGKFPGIVCVAKRLDGRIATIHRTWLTPEGTKPALQPHRKQYVVRPLAPVQGAAIRLDEPVGPILHLGEGLETMLVVRAITRQPTWSCLDANLLSQVELPEHVKVVVVWGDFDRSGTGQMYTARAIDRFREEGRRAIAFFPPFRLPDDAKSVDWNDVTERLCHKEAVNHLTSQCIPKECWADKVREFLREHHDAGLHAARNHFLVMKVLAECAKEVAALQQARSAVA